MQKVAQKLVPVVLRAPHLKSAASNYDVIYVVCNNANKSHKLHTTDVPSSRITELGKKYDIIYIIQ